ncbi:MAG TPA: PspA/IM30 family protein [Planctomycetaceae bacterium]|nr:PspA/IM30 family protein [Planctomycetaceae bacterium]
MGLFQRISDIISANLNEMTESFEDPERMLKQAIREMEQSISDATHETAKVLANEKLLAKELANNERQADDWQRKAEQAVESGDDNLARKALARKQEHQKLVTALQDQMHAAQDASRTLKHQLEGMQAKLAEAKRNLATLSARQRAADFKKKMHTNEAALETGAATDDAFAKFERMREKVERAEAEADALAELRGVKSSGDEELGSAKSAADEEIDAELQALKRRQKR